MNIENPQERINGITYSNVTNKEEIDILTTQKSVQGDFIYTYDNQTIELLKNNFDRKDSLYVIAKQGDEFVAFVSCDTDWREPDTFFMREIFVNPKFQSQGIGVKLFEQCISHAKSKGAKYVVTETAFENTSMQKLCEKFGFKKWDNSEWKDGITYKLEIYA